MRTEGAAVGYSWQTRATNIAQDTPPRKPRALEYTPFSAIELEDIIVYVLIFIYILSKKGCSFSICPEIYQ